MLASFYCKYKPLLSTFTQMYEYERIAVVFYVPGNVYSVWRFKRLCWSSGCGFVKETVVRFVIGALFGCGFGWFVLSQ